MGPSNKLEKSQAKQTELMQRTGSEEALGGQLCKVRVELFICRLPPVCCRPE